MNIPKTRIPPQHVTVISRPASLVEMLRTRARDEPQRRAFTYLDEGERETAHLSVGELDQRARAIAATLRDRNAAGERVLLVYAAGVDFVAAFFGSLYAGLIAVPVSPANPARLGRTLPRFQEIVKDAQPAVIMTTASIAEKFGPLADQIPALKALAWLATDEIAPAAADDWKEINPESGSLAYLQYTSGSTSKPKGVMVSHDNVFYDAECLEADWEHTPDSVIVNWLPHFHDFGLLYGNVQPIYSSVPAILMSPIAFMQKPIRWLRTLSDYEGTHCAAPNFAYDLCVRKTTPEQRVSLDLRKWKVAGNGGEPIRKETLERFSEAFAVSGFQSKTFCPGWGLAEGTLRVTGTRHFDEPVHKTFVGTNLKQKRATECDPNTKDAQTIVGSGSPFPGTEIVIVDPETRRRCDPDMVGEIWVSGPCVAQGYWNRNEETRETFHAYLADDSGGPFLRTGDLGFLRDNVIFVAGRYKDLIIIRGTNYYPQDIELAAELSHAACRPGCNAAFSVDVGGEERLVLVQEVDEQNLSPNEVVANIRKAITENQDVQPAAVMLIKAGSIPKTSSGKIQRNACREDFVGGKLELVAAWRAARVFSSA